MMLYNKEYFEKKRKPLSYRPNIFRCFKAVKKRNPSKVLDVGCGHGYLVRKLLNSGIEAMGVDISLFAGELIKDNFIVVNAKELPFKDKEFDVVVSKDFFEHLTEDEIDIVYQEMKRVGKYIIANICFKEEKPYHLTVKPKEWWQTKLPDVEII